MPAPEITYQITRDRILQRPDVRGRKYEEYSDLLSSGERMVLLLTALIWEVANGGFEQYLTNGSGNQISELVEALRLINADDELKLIENARDEVFGGNIPTDRQQRCDVLFALEDDENEMVIQAKEQLFDNLDKVIGFGDRLRYLAGKYVADHPSQFAESEK